MGVGKALLLALNIFCGVYGVYFIGIVVVGALMRARPAHPDAAPEKRLAAVIAARNEEAVIEGLIRTLRNQNYPSDLLDVWVIPNNCTDETDAVARAAGAKVLECTVPVKSKGDVLRFAFSELLAMNKYDGFCLFDADNIVDPGFMSAANSALCGGERIAQGFRDSKNSRESWVAGGMSVFYWFMSRLFNRGRSALGMSAMLNGTGVMISADLLRETGWETHTLTEDLEYTAQCGLRGVTIGWMEDAITYDEQPNSFWSSVAQRRRWFFGSVQCLRRYGPALWARGFKSLQAFDFGIFFLGNLIQVLMLIPGIVGVMRVIRYALAGGKISMVAAGAAIGAVAFVGGCTLIAGTLCTLVKRPLKQELPGILGFWLIAATWGPANLSALLIPPKWKAIRHGSQADLPDIPRRAPKAREKRGAVSQKASGL